MKELFGNRHMRNLFLFLLALNVVTIGISGFIKWDTYALSPDGKRIEQAYAVKAGTQLLGYTPSREEAEEAVKDIINEYIGDMVLTEGKTNLDIQYEKLKFRRHLQTQDGAEIAKQVLKDPSCEIIIIGTVLETEVIEKDTVMKETDELMKGETEVRQEGEDGTRSISSDVVIENGKVTSKKTVEKKVIKKDKDKVVMVGTRLDDGLNEDGSYRFVHCTVDEDIENSEEYKVVQGVFDYDGPVLSRSRGTISGPSGKETYYNLNMSGCINIMNSRGFHEPYWVRSDGVKMYGYYVMCAAGLSIRPKGSIVESSNGLAIVVDTGGFASRNPRQLDIAVTW
ncbi:MAG: G5 domain-containing protein [Clostridia bacterium]|nr:G5 domain-containing protein [Clostridia bacterium]